MERWFIHNETTGGCSMDFDVIIVGAGQAGIPLATRLARVGKTGGAC